MIDNDQANRIFDYFQRKFNVKLIVEKSILQTKCGFIPFYQLCVRMNNIMIMGILQTKDYDYVELKADDVQHSIKIDLIYRLFELAKTHDIIMSNVHGGWQVLVKKGTSLEQVLIEMDLNSLEI